MDDARLDLSFWKGRLNGLGQAFEAVDHGNEDVLDTAIAEIVLHLCPELGAFVGLKPQAQDVTRAVRQDRQGHKDRLVADRPVAADIDPDRVHEHHRVTGFQSRAGQLTVECLG